MTNIYFYLPPSEWREDMPEKANTFWSQYSQGQYSWTLQTYLQLKAHNINCKLVDKIPKEGIVLAHRDNLPYNLKPGAKLLLVCLKADQNSHPYAQIHVVQNPQEVSANWLKLQSIAEDRYLLPGTRYDMPHWPQPGLIPRKQERGELFANIAYFGISYNLASELRSPSWEKQIEDLGLHWHVVKERWHDYREVDAIVAVRDFAPTSNYSWKPATKLYNAWTAGVPAILGVESAFRGEQKSELDYIEVEGATELIEAIKRLQDDPGLRRAMVENGRIRAKEIQPENLAQRWWNFLSNICVPAYENWCKASHGDRKRFFMTRYPRPESECYATTNVIIIH